MSPITSNQRTALALAALCALAGCAVRDATMYRDDTRKLLETKTSELTQCYDAELQKDPNTGGKVIVTFKVQKDTGNVVDAKVDDLQSTPNRTLRKCVVDALKGLTLEPADERDGDATFTWEFKAKGS
ncbi:MAG TPA: AgmX/PglI C-terminal domain-containing protein [Polyangiales bacterium]|nr:AgmX/PglI C-terminal domain-containing protein [Polyangiales bacterium]